MHMHMHMHLNWQSLDGPLRLALASLDFHRERQPQHLPLYDDAQVVRMDIHIDQGGVKMPVTR